MATICDIVLNHTANESEWIYEHPESSYSCATMPHLRPAFILDAMLARANTDTAAGLLETFGVPVIIENEDHVQALRHQLYTNYLPAVRIYEFYQCDAEKYMKRFSNAMRTSTPPTAANTRGHSFVEIVLQQDLEYRRLGCKIDFDAAFAQFNTFR